MLLTQQRQSWVALCPWLPAPAAMCEEPKRDVPASETITHFQPRDVCIRQKDINSEINCTKISAWLQCDSLGLGLFSDILNGLTLLADDGSHKLWRHKYAQREVVVPRARRATLPRGSGMGGALIPGRTATATTAPRAGRLVGRRRVHVRDVRHLEGVVVKLASCQLLKGSGRSRKHRHTMEKVQGTQQWSHGSNIFKIWFVPNCPHDVLATLYFSPSKLWATLQGYLPKKNVISSSKLLRPWVSETVGLKDGQKERKKFSLVFLTRFILEHSHNAGLTQDSQCSLWHHKRQPSRIVC